MYGVEVEEITSEYTGKYIHVEGYGFTDLISITCNGVSASFESNYIDDEHVVFQIPSSTPMAYEMEDESLMNTLILTSPKGTAVYPFVFKDKSKMPGITSVSYSMPEPGEYIYLNGNNLSDIESVYFPGASGEIEAEEFTIESSTKIHVLVPDGVGDTSGPVRIISADGDSYYSPYNLFFTEGIFLEEFSTDERYDSRVTDDSLTESNLAYWTSSDPSESAADCSYNPDYFVSIPSSPTTCAAATYKDTSTGFFKFSLKQGLETLMTNYPDIFTSSITLDELAIEVDVYMNIPWSSGLLQLRLNKNVNGADCANCLSECLWSSSSSYDFEGTWATLTYPFEDFTGITYKNLGALVSGVNSSVYSLLGFYNYDLNSDGHTASDMEDFQINIARVRLVIAVDTE